MWYCVGLVGDGDWFVVGIGEVEGGWLFGCFGEVVEVVCVDCVDEC